jgi:hypothetical protein
VSAPRAPVDFHFTGKEVVKANTYALVDDAVAGDGGYATDATLAVEGEYAYERPEDRVRGLRKRGASDREAIVVSDSEEEEDAAPAVVAAAVDAAPAAPAVVAAPAVDAAADADDDDAEPRPQRWSGAVLPKPRRAARRAPKKPRVSLPSLTDAPNATLAHGALFKGFVGNTAEERHALITAARELRGASERWVQALEHRLNVLVPAGAPLFSFGAGADDDIHFRGWPGCAQARQPAREAREPAREAREPAREAREPVREAREPAREAREPAREARELGQPGLGDVITVENLITYRQGCGAQVRG